MIHRSTAKTFGGSHASKKIDTAGDAGNSKANYGALKLPRHTTRKTDKGGKSTGALPKTAYGINAT